MHQACLLHMKLIRTVTLNTSEARALLKCTPTSRIRCLKCSDLEHRSPTEMQLKAAEAVGHGRPLFSLGRALCVSALSSKLGAPQNRRLGAPEPPSHGHRDCSHGIVKASPKLRNVKQPSKPHSWQAPDAMECTWHQQLTNGCAYRHSTPPVPEGDAIHY